MAEDIGGYTIERDGTMLIFFAAPNVASPPSAVLGYAHELAHLAVREATQRRPLPQWFNEGYASWISARALARHHPEEAALQGKLDRLSVASALHTRELIPWADLVTRARFSRAGVEGLVNLAYGQSTLFVEFLGNRHGTPALARFLTILGEGIGATQAFGTAFGTPFGPEAAAFEQALANLKLEYQPGLYVVQRAGAERPAVLVAVGGPTLETALVELLIDGELIRRREVDFDGSGMLVASLPPTLLEDAGSVTLRVTAPLLGVLELDPIAGTSARPAAPVRAPAVGACPRRAWIDVRRRPRCPPATSVHPSRPAARRLNAPASARQASAAPILLEARPISRHDQATVRSVVLVAVDLDDGHLNVRALVFAGRVLGGGLHRRRHAVHLP